VEAKTLSPRQREIAKLVAQGKQDNEIAVLLGISEATVGFHLGKAYRKFGIHSRGELVMVWVSAAQEAGRPAS
jgi:DNA-binding CsgD family transcriptional regulator